MPHPRAIVRALLAATALCAACGHAPRRNANDEAVDVAADTPSQVDTGAGRGGASVGQPRSVASLDVVHNPDAPVLRAGQVRVDTLWSAVPRGDAPPLAHTLALDTRHANVLHGGAIQAFLLARGTTLGSLAVDSTATSLTYTDRALVVGDSAAGTVTRISLQRGRTVARVGDHPYVQGVGHGAYVANAFGGSTLVWQYHAAGGAAVTRIQLPVPPADAALARCPVVTGGPWLLVAACAYPAFRVVTVDGRLLHEVRIDRERVDTTTATAPPPGYTPRRWNERSERLRAYGYLPMPNLGVRFDPASGLFAMVWHTPASALTQVELFTREGVYLASLGFRGGWVDFAFERSTLYALEPGPGGRGARLSAYRLSMPRRASRAP